MSNIGNKIMSGFFAFPERQGAYLAKLLKQDIGSGKSAWLDPTCGEGKIINQLSELLQTDDVEIHKYGVEIDKGRAGIASELLDTVYNCPIESMVIQNDAFGFVFLNPPYDNTVKGMGDDKSERKEFIELQRASKYVQPGGVFCYVIPSYRFADKQIARFLATHFERSAIMRFTDEDYPDFKQCIFLGHKKSSVVKSTNDGMMDFFLNMYDEKFIMDNVSPISEFIDAKEWVIPSMQRLIKTFYSRIEAKNTYYEGIRNSTGFEAFKNRTKPKELEIGGQPILPLNAGQMALLLASGAVNGKIGKEKSLHLVQGMEIVGTNTEEEVIVSPKGYVSTKTIDSTTRTVSVKILTPRGVIKKLM
ncbi:DUF6094 domain-containing protein [Viridibacillus arvi]|uniref:DUF6094 domain-containing protein n=1 Tax=Viridibacillus arvi TaxID=263475 RepID=UPI0034CDFACE